jgi:UDP-N-acetylglucosamine--N-acetylmuramyl-(pentapeptide) pyrophosphoryl-undecaprenol N-acetylglucosamine transferase
MPTTAGETPALPRESEGATAYRISAAAAQLQTAGGPAKLRLQTGRRFPWNVLLAIPCQLMNAVIACGGTGGHLFPGLAVAEVLQQRGHQAMVLISEKEIDALAVRDHLGRFRFERLPAIGLPRLVSVAMGGFLRGFAVSLRRCRRYYRDFKPDAVLGMGGFTSTAPILAGRRTGVRTFIHESNAIPGKANRLNARLAGHVLLGFAACAKYFPVRARCAVTGTPIRSSLDTRLEPAAARALFGLESEGRKKTLLVMGGSQGAHGLNRAVVDALPGWGDALQVIHLTGRDDEEMVRAAYAQAGIRAWVAAFHHRMQEAYSAADLAVARSGAASLSELAHFGLPSVLIPYPFAAEDHQTLNARIYVEAGAAAALAQKDAGGDRLALTVLEIVRNPGRLAAMAGAARQLAPADAALLVVETMEKECRA